jgi:hypothetical protein
VKGEILYEEEILGRETSETDPILLSTYYYYSIKSLFFLFFLSISPAS